MGSCYWKRCFLRLTLPLCTLSPLLFCLLSLTPIPSFFPLKFSFHLWHHLFHPPAPISFFSFPPFLLMSSVFPQYLLIFPPFSFTHWPPLRLSPLGAEGHPTHCRKSLPEDQRGGGWEGGGRSPAQGLNTASGGGRTVPKDCPSEPRLGL